jgi:glycerol-3-phosphate acyltransferase PlsX
VGAAMMKNGGAVGLVSAGNTGAAMASMMLELGTLEGVDRPAIALMYPTPAGHAVILDVGANVDCKPQHLEQFAAMGTVYFRTMFNRPNPRVGVLNIGEEETKGNEIAREAHALLKTSSLNFVGNVEAKDLFHDRADVVVCDGFIGNVLLKVSENLALTFGHFLEEAIRASMLASAGFVLAKPAVKNFMKRVDYSEHGGLPLLGAKGIGIICHGRSNAKAIRNALRVASEFHEARVNESIERLLAELHANAGTAAKGPARTPDEAPAQAPEA